MSARLTIIREGEDGDEEIALPVVWAICDVCRGEGTSTAYLGAFSANDMAEDPDFAEEYFAGHYDRTCDECGGSGKVKTVDLDRMSEADRARYEEQCADDHQLWAMEEAERRAGA